MTVSCGKGDEVTSIATSTNCSSNYCIIFVSSTGTSGDIDGAGDDDGSNGIEEADALCNADSSKPNSSTYKALIVDGVNRVACTTPACSGGTGEHIDWVLQPSTEYRRVDESTAIGTTSTEGIFTFPLDNVIDLPLTINSIWTGLDDATWTTHSDLCLNWTDGTAASNGRRLSSTLDSTMGNASERCDQTDFRLYCVEQ
jgi:hypothetical protein